MPDFDLNVWNANAEAQLLAEYQARDAVNTTTNVFSRGPSSGSTSQSPGTGGGTSLGSRPLKSISSTMANVIICELPAVFSADDRIGAVKVLIGKVVASVAVTLSAECAAELERELLGQCEHIAANCAASDGERQAAENVKMSANSVASISITLAANAFASLWQYIASGLRPTPMFSQAIATNETSSYDCTLDGLVRICANIVARIVVVSLDTGCGTTPDGLPRQSVPIEVIESIIFIALYSIARWIVNQKNQRGGWAPWLGSMLRGLIVADERQRHWTGPTFDIMEGQITPRLICPITLSLVVDPVVGPYGHVFERERLYQHLQISGCDPVSKEPASALSYTCSPVAARLAKEIARHYGAYLEPL